MKNTNQRFNQLVEWLQQPERQLKVDVDSLQPASTDASFRRYFRAQTVAAQKQSIIVMDAPPQQANNTAFVDNQQRLAKAGLTVPQIHEADLKNGFLLLSDLGQDTVFHALHADLAGPALQSLYRIVLDELVRMQQADTKALPVYDAARMLSELELFYHYFLQQHCDITLTEAERQQLDGVFETLVLDNAAYPQVYVHRDFHSPNLLMPTDNSLQPGVIDFQDAVLGPITYDIASLVMDARYTWEEEQQIDWAVRYWEKARAAGLPVPEDFGTFHRAYEWMSIQRNLRILGVFSRLSQRDGKHHYLEHLPRVLAYLRQAVQRYELFNPLRALLDRIENKQTVLGLTLNTQPNS